jgi:hypothetical protein
LALYKQQCHLRCRKNIFDEDFLRAELK